MKPKEIRPEHQAMMKEIGQRIKKLRTDKKIGYIEMAKAIGNFKKCLQFNRAWKCIF